MIEIIIENKDTGKEEVVKIPKKVWDRILILFKIYGHKVEGGK